MKKIKILFGICFISLILASCSNDSNIIGNNHEGEIPSLTQLTLTGNTSENTSQIKTRISIGDKEDDHYPILWSEGDALGLFSITEGADVKNIRALLKGESIGKNSGIFTAEEVAVAKDKPTDFIIYYPYKESTTLQPNGIESKLNKEQVQSTPNNSQHIGQYSFGYAKSKVEDDTDVAIFSLKHAMSYVKFVISSTEFKDYKLKSVSLFDKETKTPISGSFVASLETREIEVKSQNDAYATVSIASPEVLSKEQEVFLTTLPANLDKKNIYIVITLEGDNFKTVSIPVLKEGKELKANTLNVIRIENLKLSDNSCDWYEPIETRLLVGGWAYGEANCIITPTSATGENTTISIKARGNFMEVEKPKFARTTLNCDLDNDKKMVGVGGSTDAMVEINNDYTMTVNAYRAGYDGGLGQVSIYGESSDKPLWSFTIWMTEQPAEHVYGNTGYTVLDRNIGAYKVFDDWKTNGAYFQWGRFTPFQWSAKGYNSIATEATNVRYSIEHPRDLLNTGGVTNTKSDWYLGAWTGARTDRKDDFWGNINEGNSHLNSEDGQKSIYDPCPKGYRMVSPKVLAEVERAGIVEKLNKITVIKYQYDGTNYALWPLAGCRWGSNAGGDRRGNTNESAMYWSNSPASNYGDDKDQGGSAMIYNKNGTWEYSAGRSHAFSVRCMKDYDNR